MEIIPQLQDELRDRFGELSNAHVHRYGLSDQSGRRRCAPYSSYLDVLQGFRVGKLLHIGVDFDESFRIMTQSIAVTMLQSEMIEGTYFLPFDDFADR